VEKGIVLDEKEFWLAFGSKLRTAETRIIIESPFVWGPRLADMVVVLSAAINRGVSVCVFLQQPKDWSQHPENDSTRRLNSFVKELRGIGVHVTLRAKRHVKLAVIDEEHLFEGSLNSMSHGTGGERMRQWKDRDEVAAAVLKERLYECTACCMNLAHYTVGHHVRNQLASWGAIFKSFRVCRAVSQREVGEPSKTSKILVSRLELGKNPRLLTAIQTAKALGLYLVLVPEYKMASVGKILSEDNRDAID
jgi:hypothetical protein